MEVGIVDALIVMFLILGGIVGFKNGAIKEGTKFIGLFAIVVISFLFKDRLMVLLYESMPFFDFFGIIKGIDAINILLYQLLAFVIIFMALYFVLNVLILITGLIEWLLKLTVFLSIPSKFIGVVVGVVEYYVYIFIVLYVLSIPIFNMTLVNESKVGNIILKNTPILSSMVDNTVNVYTDVFDIIKNKEDKSNKEVNEEVLVALLDNKLITVESASKLVFRNKITINDESIFDKYE